MKNKKRALFCMIILITGLALSPLYAQQKQNAKSITITRIPKGIVRSLIQDMEGNIWIATFEGIFRYDGKSFFNVTDGISSARFFSVLQDRKGNLWFGSIGSGVYLYDGHSFRNFTTKQGLAGNRITCIYEDKTGDIWFGADGGISCYNGNWFKNFMLGTDVNTVVEDKKGRFWIGSSGKTYVYDGKKFTVVNHEGKPFINVRSIIEDKKSNIWLGGNDGLWHYDGKVFTNLNQDLVGYIYEDKQGNILTSSQSAKMQDVASIGYNGKLSFNQAWVLSRYDEKSLSQKNPTMTEIKPNQGMICGILETYDGTIWFGTSNGVYRYHGNTVMGFNSGKVQK